MPCVLWIPSAPGQGQGSHLVLRGILRQQVKPFDQGVEWEKWGGIVAYTFTDLALGPDWLLAILS